MYFAPRRPRVVPIRAILTADTSRSQHLSLHEIPIFELGFGGTKDGRLAGLFGRSVTYGRQRIRVPSS
jgi:hypothetical protein